MAYLSIYRKYRPDSFDSVIGQEHIVRILCNQVKTDTVSHAYLFTGTRGTGKTSIAKIFARAINCPHNVNGSSCGVCEVCRELAMPNNLDILELDAASNNGVDDIRDIRETVKYAPTVGKYKVYIIDEAHMLSTGAFNALLKTLEEPPSHAVFILATTEAHKLPETILSRCMRFDFRLLSAEQLCGRIKYIFDDLGATYEDSAVKAIAEAGDGSVRDALSVADMCLSYSNGNITYNDTLEVLGASSPAKIVDVINAMMQPNSIKAAYNIIEELMGLGKSVLALARDITKMLRNLYLIKSCGKDCGIVVLPDDIITRLMLIAAKVDSARIINTIDMFAALEGEMRYTRMPRIMLDNTVAKASEITSQININALLARIKTLESKIESGVQIASPSAPSEKVAEVKKRQFNAMEALGILVKTLDAEKKLIARQLANGLDDRNFTLTSGMMKVGVDNDAMLDSLIKDNCAGLFAEIWGRSYEVSRVEFFPIQNKRDIAADIESVKNLIGAKWVKVIK